MKKIALITPACRGDIAGSTIQEDAAKLDALAVKNGLDFCAVFIIDSVSKFYPYLGAELANTPQQRARQIINFAQDPEVIAMWAVHGGESGPETAKLLNDYGKNPEQYLKTHAIDPLSGEILQYAAGAPRGFPQDRDLPTIIGMSDVSSVQIALSQFGFPSHYGNVTLAESALLEKMASSVIDKTSVGEFHNLEKLSEKTLPEKITGPVYATVSGGLYSSLRTNWQPEFLPETVLMMEGVSGYSEIAQTLREANHNGALRNVQTLIIGNPDIPGNPVDTAGKIALKTLVDQLNIPTLLLGGNQFGHLSGIEPTPVANFGTITIDATNGSALISQEHTREALKSYRTKNFLDPKSTIISSSSDNIFSSNTLVTNLPELELFPLNQAAQRQENLHQLTDVIGGPVKKIPEQIDAEGKTLIISGDTWVRLGRNMTDYYNKGDLDGVNSIIFAIPNHYPEIKSRLENAQSDQEKVAVGLSVLGHAGFKYEAMGNDLYRCDFSKTDVEARGEDLKKWADNVLPPKFKGSGLEVLPQDIQIDGSVLQIRVDSKNNAEIIRKISDEEMMNRSVLQCEKRVEYFARRYLDKDPQSAMNQAGDLIDREVAVFMTDLNALPKEMGRLFAADSVNVRLAEKQPEEIQKETLAEKFGLKPRDSNFLKEILTKKAQSSEAKNDGRT